MDGDAVAAAENVPLHRYQRANKGYVEALGDGATLTLMQIPAGELWMGTGAADAGVEPQSGRSIGCRYHAFLWGRAR